MANSTRPAQRTDLGYQANRLARLLRRRLATELSSLGFTSRQAGVLLALAGTDALTMGALADRLGVDKPTLSGVVKRLARDGWVEVVPHPDDGRSRLVRFSSQGMSVVPELELASGRATRHALRDLSGDEHERLFALLERICVALETSESREADR
jgi:MarR family transcriptional regulator, transcriptional regulator for hemolysin